MSKIIIQRVVEVRSVPYMLNWLFSNHRHAIGSCA
jgi:hypothetical protein